MGLLERLPQRINERPPYYLGRDYLETLMASQQAADWIRIRCLGIEALGVGVVVGGVAQDSGLTLPSAPPPYSEMLLGPVPPNFVFLPKHKANAYK